MISLLYVDDETTLLEIGKIFLERDGDCRVDTSPDARDALKKLESAKYDAIIADYEMPNMNGIALLKAVRLSGNTIPFILFTGRGREEVVIQALNEGADFYLQKGGDPKPQFAELKHKVRQAISQREAKAKIKDHERLEADILNFLPDATFAIDITGHVIAWNQAIEEMTGVIAADMLGKGENEYSIPFYKCRKKILIDLIFEPDNLIRDRYEHIIHENNVLIAETTLPSPKGKACRLMGKASPLYDQYGTIIGAIESIRDITELKAREEELQAINEELMASEEELRHQYDELADTQKELRGNQEQLTELAETIPGVMFQFVVRPDGLWELQFLSSRAEELTGYSGEPAAFFPWFTEQVDPRDREPFLSSIQEAVQAKSLWNFEWRFVRPSGAVVWFEGLSRPKRHENTLVYNGVLLDISERKFAELAIRDSEEKYRKLVETTRTGFVIIDDRGCVIDANQEYVRLTGRKSRADILGKSVIEWTAPYEQEKNHQAVLQCIQKGYIRNFVIDYQHEDGTKVPVEINATLLHQDGMIQLHTLCRDISERKQAEEAINRKSEELHAAYEELAATGEELRDNLDELQKSEQALQESEQLYRSVIENIQDIYYRSDREGNLILVSPSGVALLGYDSLDELIGRPIQDLYYHPKDRDIFLVTLKKTGSVSNYETILQKKDKTPVHVSTSSHFYSDQDGRIAGVEGILRDISALKQAQDALRESEEKYRLLVEKAYEGILIAQDGCFRFVNPRISDMIGIPASDLIGRPFIEYVHPDDREMVATRHQKRSLGNAAPDVYDFRIIGVQGRITWVHISATVVSWNDKPAVLCFFTDITARKDVEKALQESERILKTMISNLPGFVYRCANDNNWTMEFISEGCREITGYDSEDMVQNDLISYNDLVHPDWQEWLWNTVQRYLAESGAFELEYPIITKDGETRHVWERGRGIYGEDNQLLYLEGFITDVTRQKQMEEALRQANQKLLLLTGLTRHDILNHMTVIQGYLNLALEESDLTVVHELIKRARDRGDRIESTVGFTRVYENFGLESSSWRKVYPIIESAKKEIALGDITVLTSITPSLEVFIDPIIQKVFSTLFDNAVRHGKQVTKIEITAHELESALIIACADDGIGIPDSDKERIFEHGFGKNSGIGLYLAREILAITNLSIRETGEYGNGARFEITIPAGKFREQKDSDLLSQNSEY